MKLPSTIFVTNKSNIRWLTGFSGTSGYVVAQGKKGFLLTDARYHLVAKKVLPKNYRLVDITGGFEEAWKKLLNKMRVKKMAVEESDITVQLFNYIKKISKGVRLTSSKNYFEMQRMVKRPDEIAAITKAQKITDEILLILRKWLRAGQNEKEIAWKIEVLARECGADGVSFPAIIGINENSASPHHHPTEKKLKRGDMILIDMGVIYRGYCSDMTRVLFTKKPTSEQAHIYNTVLDAQETAIRKIKAGVTGEAIDTVAREIITKAGFGKNFGHSLGHGVGLDVHELPNLSQKYTGKIPPGTVVTSEPGIYLPGKFGVRIEDMLLVGEKNAKILTKSLKTLDSLVI